MIGKEKIYPKSFSIDFCFTIFGCVFFSKSLVVDLVFLIFDVLNIFIELLTPEQ